MNLLSIAASLVALAGSAEPQTQKPTDATVKVSYSFVIMHGAQRLGTASYERISDAKERHTLLTIDETDATSGDSITATIEAIFKRDGTPAKKTFHGLMNMIPFSRSAVFTPAGVQYTTSTGPTTGTPKTIIPPANGVLADASERWFDGVTPKVGDIAEFTNFNVQTGTWEQTSSKYVGDEETKIGTKTYKTHHVHVKSDTGEIDMYLDDYSDIVVMDQLGAVRLERAE